VCYAPMVGPGKIKRDKDARIEIVRLKYSVSIRSGLARPMDTPAARAT